jgi:uncharacterized membrane protein YjdF
MVALTVPQWESMLVMLMVVLSVQTMERLMEWKSVVTKAHLKGELMVSHSVDLMESHSDILTVHLSADVTVHLMVPQWDFLMAHLMAPP